MDSLAYGQLLNKIRKSNAIPHHNFPSHNLLSAENLAGVSGNLDGDIPQNENQFLTTFPCYRPFPYAVSKTFPCFCGSGVTDDAQDLVKKKLKWQKDLKDLKLYDIAKAKKQIKDLRRLKTTGMSKNLRKHIEHFCNDPEPKFCGNYNWLYSGGTLCHIDTPDGPIIISADNFQKNPGFNILRFDESSDEIHCEFSSSLKTSSPVLQTTCKFNDANLILCVRQKDRLSLYGLSETARLSGPVKLWKKKTLYPSLIICADLNTNGEQVVLSNSHQDLYVYDIERKKKMYRCAGRKIFPDSIRDPWTQVAFDDPGLHVAFRNCFVVLDPRDDCSVSFKYFPSFAVNNCEDICSFVRSCCDSNFVYLGTTHSVLQVDMRNGETVQKWTHLMKKPPQFLAVTKDPQEKEILLLQSQDVRELVAIANEPVKDGGRVGFVSRSLPRVMRSIEESLAMARFRGLCLSPFLAEKLSFSITGMRCMKGIDGAVNLFINNSGGDVFLSKIEKTQADDFPAQEPQVLKAMETYESRLQSLPHQPMSSLLRFVDMSHVLKDIRDFEWTPREVRKPEVGWKYHEMYSLESLEFYKDFLAPKILRVWRHDAGSDSDDGEKGGFMSVERKVREWMKMNEG